MATPTYVALDTVTVGTATPSITFSSISQNYNNLVIIAQAGYTSTNAGQGIGLRFNGDSSNAYSATILEGDGTSRSSYRGSNASAASCGAIANGTQTNFGSLVIEINNYRNTDTYKNFLFRNSGPTYIQAGVGYWRPSGAGNISSITIVTQGTAGNIAVGSTFTLYGIVAEGQSPAPKATGGAIYSDSTYYYHVFGSSGVFTPSTSLTADVLVVAGGGGAGSRWGGGGGAGGLLAFTSQSLSATNYTCTVGAGGAGGGGTTTGGIGSTGGDSQFGALTLVKGGGYGLRWLSAQSLGAAGTGGSGGGATSTANGTTSSAGSNTSGQGFIGGGSSDNAAGGGGAGGAGNAGNASKSGDGGVGSSTYSAWGIATGVGQNVAGTYYLAGGGGGGTASNTLVGGTGGYGGGGNGNNGVTTNNPTGNGQFATGGGGGGAGNNNDSASVYGGNGGSGVVIVRYLKA